MIDNGKNGLSVFELRSSKDYKQHYTYITTRIILVLILVSIPYAILFWQFSKPLAVGVAFLILLYLVSWSFLKWGLFKLARLMLVGTIHIGVLIYASAFGRELGIQLLLFPFIILPLAMFAPDEQPQIILSTLISVGSLGILEISNYSLSPITIRLSSDVTKYIFVTGHFVIMLILIIFVKIFTKGIFQLVTDKESACIDAARAELLGVHQTVVVLQHEINNALTSILSGADLLARNSMDKNSMSIANLIKQSGQRIQTVIQKLEAMRKIKHTPYLGSETMIDIS